MTQPSPLLQGKRVAFLGKLGAMTRREACQWIKQHGAIPSERMHGDFDLVVIGADELPDEDIHDMLSSSIRKRLRSGQTSLIHEHDLWLQLGMLDDSSHKQLYTPAMVAGLIKARVNHIRRWHRMGLLPSIKVAHRLPYFDFEQVQCARQLAHWISQGARPTDIRRQLEKFSHRIQDRSLIDLELVVDGRQILLRDQGKLLESNGQLHLDFDGNGEESSSEQELAALATKTFPIARDASLVNDSLLDPSAAADSAPLSRDQMLAAAEELEDAGRIEPAIEWYRVILSQFGPNAEIAFQLAELLYRSGDISAARERYYNAVEIDEDFVEARANLGCVLAELGQPDLAIAAFEGALSRDDRYPDVHYHLARSLDEIGQPDHATKHWIRFLQLSPQSPWADEALERLGKL